MAKPSTGVPVHITLIFPFMTAADLDADLIAEVSALIGTATSFRFALQETDRFPAALFLAPNPAEPFIRLTEAITERLRGKTQPNAGVALPGTNRRF